MAPPRRPTAAAPLLLLALLLAAAAPVPAAGQSCKSRIKGAIRACDKDLWAVVWAAQAAQPIDASALDPSPDCCAAAKDVFSADFMVASGCGCDASVIEQTTVTVPAALEALRTAATAKCGVGAADLEPFPTCAWAKAPAGAAAAAAAGGGGVGTNVVIVPDPAPQAGPGSKCKSTVKCGKPVCASQVGGVDSDKWKKAKDKCYGKSTAGFCDFTRQFADGKGVTVCGQNGTDNVAAVPVTLKNGTVEQCIACCQALGDVYIASQDLLRPDLNMCSKGASRCFPGSATVTLADGSTKPMGSLAVGDRVLALRPDGALAFEEVYFFDHQVAGGDHEFVRLALTGGAGALELSDAHFVPVGESLARAVMTRARDVKAGATLLVVPAGGEAAAPAVVESVSVVRRAGLYAPVTTGGTLVVDGVVASAYSDWVLDPLFDALGKTHMLPAAMHVVHAPLRLAYAVLGRRVMAALSPLVSGVAMMDAAQIAAGLGLAVSA